MARELFLRGDRMGHSPSATSEFWCPFILGNSIPIPECRIEPHLEATGAIFFQILRSERLILSDARHFCRFEGAISYWSGKNCGENVCVCVTKLQIKKFLKVFIYQYVYNIKFIIVSIIKNSKKYLKDTNLFKCKNSSTLPAHMSIYNAIHTLLYFQNCSLSSQFEWNEDENQ